MKRAHTLASALFALAAARTASAQPVVQGRGDVAATSAVTYSGSVARAREAAPEIAIARSHETVAAQDVRVAGVYPNPLANVGTSTQTARLTVGATIPLVVLGQRRAAIDASEAELDATRSDTVVTIADSRAAAARAYVALWLAERVAREKRRGAEVAAKLDDSVKERVAVGSAPEVEGLRAHAERLRAAADAAEAEELVAASSIELGRWLGEVDRADLRTSGDPEVPSDPPPLAELLATVPANAVVRREDANARAAEARAQRERALVRPQMALDVGADFGDPTLPATNYRALLSVELPLFNQRGPQIAREEASAAAARSRADAERLRTGAALAAAYRRFVAIGGRERTLASAVVPAVEAAARATNESYTVGRAPLVAVLEAERARIEAEVSLLEARAARANAWIDVELARGGTP